MCLPLLAELAASPAVAELICRRGTFVVAVAKLVKEQPGKQLWHDAVQLLLRLCEPSRSHLLPQQLSAVDIAGRCAARSQLLPLRRQQARARSDAAAMVRHCRAAR